jgi:hypothetical protein
MSIWAYGSFTFGISYITISARRAVRRKPCLRALLTSRRSPLTSAYSPSADALSRTPSGFTSSNSALCTPCQTDAVTSFGMRAVFQRVTSSPTSVWIAFTSPASTSLRQASCARVPCTITQPTTMNMSITKPIATMIP